MGGGSPGRVEDFGGAGKRGTCPQDQALVNHRLPVQTFAYQRGGGGAGGPCGAASGPGSPPTHPS